MRPRSLSAVTASEEKAGSRTAWAAPSSSISRPSQAGSEASEADTETAAEASGRQTVRRKSASSASCGEKNFRSDRHSARKASDWLAAGAAGDGAGTVGPRWPGKRPRRSERKSRSLSSCRQIQKNCEGEEGGGETTFQMKEYLEWRKLRFLKELTK